ncbi:MAG: hypothetical protein LAT63_06890 [Marinobacter sp.]|nr:hypothetical protein [Marinobacter sp.]
MRILATLLLLTASAGLSAGNLLLHTFHAPPYQIAVSPGSASTGVRGSTVETVQCILEKMEWTATTVAVPPNRAVHSLRNRMVDGYYAVDPSDTLDQYAVASSPIALEKWFFFSKRPLTDYRQARIGVIAGSNEAAWMAQHGYPIHMQANVPEQLLTLLYRDRIDAIMTDLRLLEHLQASATASATGAPPVLYGHFLRFAPLSFYINRRVATEHPTFLTRFNTHIADCVSKDFALSPVEQDHVKALTQLLMKDLRSNLNIEGNLLSGMRYQSMGELLNLDRQWEAMAPVMASPLAKQLLEHPDSRRLRDWQERHQGLVTEAFIFDDVGAITALSHLTSDYWQGNEDKFLRVVDLPPGESHLYPIYFDDSARHFQVIVSTPVHQRDGQFMGAVVLGLDIERAMQTINGEGIALRLEDLPASAAGPATE